MLSQTSERVRPRLPHLVLAAGLLALACLSGCGSGKNNSNKATPTATPSAVAATLTAQQWLDEAVKTTEALNSFHFVLNHENGTTPVANGIAMRRADGDFLKPDRFKADVAGTLGGGLAVDVKVINVGDQVWLNLTGNKYAPLPGGVGAAAILDPNNGVLKALKGVQSPAISGAEKLNGVDTTIVSGTIDAGDLTALAQAAQAGKPVKGKVWIGNADHRAYRLRIDGPLNDSEPANIARVIDLSQFDEKLDIQPPQ